MSAKHFKHLFAGMDGFEKAEPEDFKRFRLEAAAADRRFKKLFWLRALGRFGRWWARWFAFSRTDAGEMAVVVREILARWNAERETS